jgi:hypothetical protein
MEFLTTAAYPANPALDRSKCISILCKQCLKSLCNAWSIGSLIVEKSDDHSLIILYLQYLIKVSECREWENNYGFDRRVEIDSISLTFQRIHSLKIISCETRSTELCVRGWRRDFWIKGYVLSPGTN